MVRKNIFLFLILLTKINKSEIKKKSQKIKQMDKMGSGGAISKIWCE